MYRYISLMLNLRTLVKFENIDGVVVKLKMKRKEHLKAK